MTRNADPEREMVRRAVPFAPPAFVLALALGTAAGGWNAGWSAAIGVAVVAVNFVANGLSLARAARLSLQALYAVALGGFIVRMGAVLAVLFLLDRFGFFSPVAFLLAIVPTTILLLAYEMKVLWGKMGTEAVLIKHGGGNR